MSGTRSAIEFCVRVLPGGVSKGTEHEEEASRGHDGPEERATRPHRPGSPPRCTSGTGLSPLNLVPAELKKDPDGIDLPIDADRQHHLISSGLKVRGATRQPHSARR